MKKILNILKMSLQKSLKEKKTKKMSLLTSGVMGMVEWWGRVRKGWGRVRKEWGRVREGWERVREGWGRMREWKEGRKEWRGGGMKEKSHLMETISRVRSLPR